MAVDNTIDNKEWLYNKYVVEKLTTYKIAEIAECSQSSVGRSLKKFGIETRGPEDCHKKETENRICPSCSKEFQVGGRGRPKKDQVYCSRNCHMKNQSPRQTGSNVPRPRKYKDTLHNKEWLYTKYIDEQLSTTEIGKIIGAPRATVKWALRKWDITGRSNSESRKVLFDKLGRKDVSQLELIEAYGSKCACCGETRVSFLTLDHIGGGGSQHRRSFRGNHVRKIRQELKAQGWPKDKYRLLCMNCNHATRYGKTCPHELERQANKEHYCMVDIKQPPVQDNIVHMIANDTLTIQPCQNEPVIIQITNIV